MKRFVLNLLLALAMLLSAIPGIVFAAEASNSCDESTAQVEGNHDMPITKSSEAGEDFFDDVCVHHWVSEVMQTASCTVDGVMTYTCSVCGETYTGSIPATGHREEVISGKAATCTENGLTDGIKCADCDAILVEQDTIPATGHHYEKEVTAPTRTARGYTTYTCTICGEQYVDDYVNALKSTSTLMTTGSGSLTAPVLSSIKNSADGVTVSWDAVSGAAQYRVFYRLSSDSTWKTAGTTNSTSYTVTDLKSGSKYSFSVRCVNNDGDKYTSPYATAKSITRIAQPKLTSLTNCKNGVMVKWSTVRGAEQYRVLRKEGNSTAWVKIGDFTSYNTLLDQTAKSGVKYTYTVRCVNSAGTKYTSSFDTIGESITYNSAITKKRIYLSPSDQTENAYASGNTTEAVQCRRIADALKSALTRCGFSVINNKYDTMEDRVEESNNWGADLHVPLHTNAFNGEVSGTRIFSYDTGGNAYQCAKKIYHYLAPLTPGDSDNISTYPTLYEVRNSVAPCVYIESEFHDVPDVAKWIISHTEHIGEAICHGICDYFGTAYIENWVVITDVSNSAKGVTVKWKPIDGAEKYRVMYKKSSDDSWMEAESTTGTSYTVTNLSSGTDYTFTVRCVNSDGNYIGSYDTIGKSITYIAPPAVTSVKNSGKGVTVKWNPVDGADRYLVWYKESSANRWTKAASTTTGTGYTVTGLASGIKYTFTVRCVNSAGTKYISSYDAAGLEKIYIAQPKLTVLRKGDNGITVKWGAVAGAKQYRIFRKTGSTGSWTALGSTSDTVFLDKTAKLNTRYSYTVRCMNSAGTYYTSSYDTVGRSITCVARPVLSSLRNMCNGIALKWNAVAGAEQYRVYYRIGNGSWIKAGNTTITSYTVTGLTSGKTYTFIVRCMNSSGTSFTSTASIGKSIKRLSMPTLKSAVSSGKGIPVTWGKVTGADGYYVYRKSADGNWSKIASIRSGNTVSFTDTKASKGVTYYYSVRAYSGTYTSCCSSSGISCKR
ncbi:MAG: fibronectin type III domain-containing protein [Clostridiales bacterium]|nr:fibronectin type III domain-containing protein [Candidatus Cacconaster stercorequi]